MKRKSTLAVTVICAVAIGHWYFTTNPPLPPIDEECISILRQQCPLCLGQCTPAPTSGFRSTDLVCDFCDCCNEYSDSVVCQTFQVGFWVTRNQCQQIVWDEQ